ncbi:hypothetical protein V1264_020204 [Littorina saxatilis]|uniref:TBC1 domain family member 30 n=1 Tax=Littorina saxatilis TaxID=31220 RepID=A0AAN9BAT8_9CAEN
MARVTAGGCNAAQISPELSDDEVFHTDEVWRPLRTNGHPTTTTVSPQTLQDVQLDRSEESTQMSPSFELHDRNRFGFRGQNTSSDQDEFSYNESLSFNASGNRNNNRPGGLCSVPYNSDVSENAKPWSDSGMSEAQELQCRRPHMHKLDRQHSIVDGLLFEIYDRWHGSRADSFDSDTFTECSSTSEVFHTRWDSYYETADQRIDKQYTRSFLESQSTEQLKRMVSDMQRSVGQTSGRLVRQLKRRDRRLAKQSRNCDVVTAVLQAASLKRQIDTRMKFSLDPPPGQSAFDQWKDAMKAVNRLPMGIPPEFRKKVWLSLADHYIRKLKIDWHKTVRLAFNERSNPDDDKLGMQIVKDLHRTGCSSFSGQDNEQDRAVLKRVLLAYARWNKRIGYCQGFNVIAALLLNVMERKEDDALKVMIYLIDHVLPESYFDNNLRALSVDMAVFRDLLRMTLPTLSRHLDRLQHAAQDVNTGACYEPPLTNVFTMQWFLTIFATCLPKEVVLRVWDAILLEGSEVLLRTALCLWGKLARRIMKVDSADEFYSLMGELSSDMMEGTVFNSDDMIKAIYAIAPFPFPQLSELREKYTYNIRPFSSAPAPSRKGSRVAKAVLYSDEDELDEDELRAFPGMSHVQGGKGKGVDISLVGPGAYGAESDMVAGSRDAVYMERMTTDLTALKMQYDKLRLRQRQAHVFIAAAASAKKAVQVKQKAQAPVLVPKIESPLAMNHLFVGKVQGGRNRLVTDGPRIAAPRNSLLTKQLQAVAAAQAASRSKRSPAKNPPTPRGSPAAAQPTLKREATEGRDSAQHFSEESLRMSESQERICEESADHQQVSDVTVELEATGCVPADGAEFEEGKEDCIRRDSISSVKGYESGDGENSENVGDRFAFTEEEEEENVSTSSQDDMELSRTSLSEDMDPLALSRVQSCPQTLERYESRDEDSGVVVLSPSPDVSAESSPERKPQRPTSFQLCVEDAEREKSHSSEEFSGSHQDCGGSGDGHHHSVMARSLSAPNGMATAHVKGKPTLTPATTPTHRHPPTSLSAATTPTSSSHHLLSSPSHPPSLSSPCSLLKTNRPFNPFPVKHVNTNRAKTGLKLGLYTPSTLEQIQGQLRGGLSGIKARNASS